MTKTETDHTSTTTVYSDGHQHAGISMDLQLSGRHVLVTGSHRGTGLLIAKRFIEEGSNVAVHGFDQTQASDAVAELKGGYPVFGDICRDEGTQILVEQLKATPEILVNNYGTAESGRWETLRSSDWVDLYQKNVLSAERLIQAFLPGMRTMNRARIINLGTVGSTRPNSRNPHYYAAKGALATMTVSLAKEVAGTNIRVNLVSPGMILTPEVREAYMRRGTAKGWGNTWEEIEPHIAADIPIGRIVRRDEVADLVVFLASAKADAIHGQNIRIDGGALDFVT